ncbi:hypothetical protein AKO1_015817 [Acrasis kona]|uniref:Uncharacterized protein n=1 Tax=Acrasis kona TaxID=1008807 RepID=A0AAW2ZHH6_9EUKA
MFTCVFDDEVNAAQSALGMRQALGESVKFRISIDSCEGTLGLLGDRDEIVCGAIGEQVLLSGSLLNNHGCKKRIVVSKDVYIALSSKKQFSHTMAYAGRVHSLMCDDDTPGANAYTEIYQMSEEDDPVKPNVKKKYGLAMRKTEQGDFVGALDMLELFVEHNKSDVCAGRMRDVMKRTLNLCQKISKVWDLHDTCFEQDFVYPSFEIFCKSNGSFNELMAWGQMRELRVQTRNKDRLLELVNYYCDSSRVDKIKVEICNKILMQRKTSTVPLDVFDAMLGDLEQFLLRSHDRFKLGRCFANAMYSAITNGG